MEIHSSAGRQGVSTAEMLHAFDHSVLGDDLGEDPDRWLVIGPDWAANLLEIIVLITSTGEQMIIHAMRLRATHRILLDS
ncbi:hypothetical protein [Candidatus Neomicrothrix sp.]|uniref:hypothetical protein n=2 Tax=Candidatus Neomicrothrix sp. TaxID=2719034 RepID=UPI0025BB6C80|nr:hypothetical protein [Candidatus Microthrix sp.]